MADRHPVWESLTPPSQYGRPDRQALPLVIVVGGLDALALAQTATTSDEAQSALAELMGSGLLNTAFISVFYGTIRYGLDRRSGVTTRTILVSHRGPVLLAKAVTAALAGTAIGAVAAATTAAMLAMTIPAVSPDGSLLLVVLGGLAASAATAAWGLLSGVLVRNEFLVPVAALLVLAGSGAALDTWQTVGPLLPLGTVMALVFPARSGLVPWVWGAAGLSLWLGVVGLAAWWSLCRRDVG